MELKFQHALYGVGAFLVLFGIGIATFRLLALGSGGDITETVSQGFTSAFFALFSGVLIGVGLALLINGASFSLRGNAIHIIFSIFLLAVSSVIGIIAISDAKSAAFHSLVIFFAGMASAGVFLLSALAFAFSGLLKDYVATHPPDSAHQQNSMQMEGGMQEQANAQQAQRKADRKHNKG